MTNSCRVSRLFCLLLSVLLGVVLVGAIALVQQRSAASQTLSVLRSREREFEQLRAAAPQAADAGLDALRAVCERTEGELHALRSVYQRRGDNESCCDTAEPAPSDRAGAYFRLLQLREHLRDTAHAAGVTLRPTEYFAFASYTNSGPEPEQIAEVHRQSQAVARTLHALFRARPHRLNGIARERLATARPGSASVVTEGDFFTSTRPWSGARSGLVEAIALRVSFVGETRALREFLRDLGAGMWPVHICSVEAEPAAEAVEPPSHLDRTAFTPLANHRLSQFTVTLERLEVPIALPRQTVASESLTANPR